MLPGKILRVLHIAGEFMNPCSSRLTALPDPRLPAPLTVGGSFGVGIFTITKVRKAQLRPRSILVPGEIGD